MRNAVPMKSNVLFPETPFTTLLPLSSFNSQDYTILQNHDLQPSSLLSNSFENPLKILDACPEAFHGDAATFLQEAREARVQQKCERTLQEKEQNLQFIKELLSGRIMEFNVSFLQVLSRLRNIRVEIFYILGMKLCCRAFGGKGLKKVRLFQSTEFSGLFLLEKLSDKRQSDDCSGEEKENYSTEAPVSEDSISRCQFPKNRKGILGCAFPNNINYSKYNICSKTNEIRKKSVCFKDKESQFSCSETEEENQSVFRSSRHMLRSIIMDERVRSK